MKNLTLFFSLFMVTFATQAQGPWQTRMDHIFQHVNKSSITTGLLADYAMPLADLKRYHGGTGSWHARNPAWADSALVTMEIWRKLYGTLMTADIRHTQPLPLLSSVNADIAQRTTGDTIPLALMWIHYQQLEEDAISSGKMNVVNTDQLSNNLSYTPLDNLMAVAATPTENVSRDGTVKFLYDTTLFITHKHGSVPYPMSRLNVAADFDDGNGYISLQHGTVYNVRYTTEGQKKIRFQLTYTPPAMPYLPSHPQSVFTQAWFYVVQPSPGTHTRWNPWRWNGTEWERSVPDEIFSVTARQSFPQFSGNFTEATVSIAYSNFPEPTNQQLAGDRILDKPLILIEGLDLGGMLEGEDENFEYWDAIQKLENDNTPCKIGINFKNKGQSVNFEYVKNKTHFTHERRNTHCQYTQ